MTDNILDSVEVRGINADGDDRVTLILLTWIPDENLYQVEQRCDGQYEKSYMYIYRENAELAMNDLVSETRYHYNQERASYERGLKQDGTR